MIPLKDDNPTTIPSYVTLGLIAINITVFLVELSLGARETRELFLTWGAIPYELIHGTDLPPYSPIPLPLTLFTSMFLHADFFHIGFNLLYLWIFGNNIESAMGHFRFLCFYLLCGIIASLAHIAVNASSSIPMVGASGAIAGVLGAYFLLYPRAKIHTLVFFFFLIRIIPLPAVVILGLWFMVQVFSSLAGGGGIAWHAHIGGFVAGFVLLRPFTPQEVWRVKKRGKRRYSL